MEGQGLLLRVTFVADVSSMSSAAEKPGLLQRVEFCRSAAKGQVLQQTLGVRFFGGLQVESQVLRLLQEVTESRTSAISLIILWRSLKVC